MITRTRLLIAVVATTCLGLAGFAAAAEAAAPAWSPVAATGPTVLPAVQSEVQRLEVRGEGGDFKLTAKHDVTLASGTGSYSYVLRTVSNVSTSSGTFEVGQEVGGEAIPDGTTITEITGNTLTLSANPECCSVHTNAPIRAVERTVSTTGFLPYDASAGEVESALNLLAAVGGAGGTATVSGGPGTVSPFTIRFGGALANQDIAELVADGSGLTGEGSGATTATVVGGGPGTTQLSLYAFNVGGYESEGVLTATIHLPDGVTILKTPTGSGWVCDGAAGEQEVTCTASGVKIAPSTFTQPILAEVTAAAGASSGTVSFTVEGGGAEPASGRLPLEISGTPAQPGVQSFSAGAYDSNGHLDSQAGDHPYSASTAIFVNTIRSPTGDIVPAGEFKDISVDLPPGFLGNPQAVPQCPEAIEEIECPFSTMVGLGFPLLKFGAAVGGFDTGQSAVFNTEAPLGYPGKFRFNVLGLVPLNVVGSLRSDSDYGLTAASLNTPQIKSVFGTFFTFWGAPAEASHDSARCNRLLLETHCGPAAEGDPVAFLTNSTNCSEEAISPPVTTLRSTLWQEPGKTFVSNVDIPPVTGCDRLKFDAGFEFHSDETRSDSPAAFKTSLTVPGEGLTDPEKLTTPELKQTVIRLPKGISLNPSAADGLEACSEAQVGFLGGDFPMPNPMHFNLDPNQCPDASKIGTGEVETPLIDGPLQGSLYLAAQGDGNPFGSLFAVYLVIEDPRHGIYIKLPGRVDADEATGQLTVTFQDLPQVPFTRLDLNLKGGSRAPLANPEACGTYETTAEFTPWSAPESGPPTNVGDPMSIDSGPDGGACAPSLDQRPFGLGMTAGSADPTAGAHSPFSIRITRPDGAQEMTTLDITPPAGFTAVLKGVPYCPDSSIAAAAQKTGREEQGAPSCSSSSQVGTTQVGAGAGPNPFYTGGKLYLAGPYKGAPLSVVAITPAVAGPFDLGNVVVRTALFVNPETAQITAKSDPLPQYLKGVQLRIRDVRINLDRSDWALNPTSCDPSAVNTTVAGNSGAVSNLSSRFQVGGCADLKFGPKLALKLKGGTKRGKYPALTATVTQPAGQANIGYAQVALPHSEFLAQEHIGTVCTRVQFAEKKCPAASIYGFAEAESPLLDDPLKGNVYLRSSSHKLPDLVAELRGPATQPIEIDLDGRIDSFHSGIRNTFEMVPDAPVSRFVLKMRGGKKGLLVNSTNICAGKHKASVKFIGQNSRVAKSSPKLQAQCRKAKKKTKKKSHHR